MIYIYFFIIIMNIFSYFLEKPLKLKNSFIFASTKNIVNLRLIIYNIIILIFDINVIIILIY
jgi:hypothetical protein